MALTSSKPIYQGIELYFDEPRFRLTIFGRSVVRMIGYVSYLVLGVAFIVLVFSSIMWVQEIGVLLGLFLMDRLIHRKGADRLLSELPESGKINVARYVRPAALLVIERAMDKSQVKKSSFALEVIKQLFRMKLLKEGIVRMDLNPNEVMQKLDEFLRESAQLGFSSKEVVSQQIEILIKSGFQSAVSNAHKFVEPADLFAGLTGLRDSYVQRLLSLFSIEPGDLGRALLLSTLKSEFSRLGRSPMTLGGLIHGSERRIRHRIMNRAWTSRPTPILDKHSVDLTDLARREQVGFLVGHGSEYNRLVDALARPTNPNALLVGEDGVGKETLVSHLAFQLIKDKVPGPLFDKRLVLLQLPSLVAGATPDELQERLKEIVEEITIAENVILYIPGIHNLVKTSGTGYLSAADALIPIINNNAFPVIGSTYPREFKEFLERRSDFTTAFEVIRVDEISEEEAEKLLVYESLILEREVGLIISFGAIKMAVKLAKKYFRNKFLPSSADELLKSALTSAKRRGDKFLTPELVVRTAEEKINIPIHEAGREESGKLINLENLIHEQLVDQDEAVKAVSDVLRAYRSGLAKQGAPIASFLFVGPTGVGKTELSKILAEIQFGSREMMIRFDMTEYQDKQSFYRFIGSPDGQVSGVLTDQVLKKPYSLVLLDEFEKAYPDILDLFLQVFDDGRLTDNLGRTVSFEHAMIIATSNAHSDIINEALNSGQTMSETAEYLKRRLTDVFKPELINRFSKIVVFNNLLPADLKKIVKINLKRFSSIVEEQGVELSYDQEVVERIGKLGYDPAYGARPLERVITDKLRAVLAKKILTKDVVRGSKVKVIVSGENEFDFISLDRDTKYTNAR